MNNPNKLHHPSPPDVKARGIHPDIGTTGSDDLKRELALSDLIRDLAHAQEARKKLFAAIVRLVQRREAKGPAGRMMEQIRRDERLCKLLTDYEEQSEIIGMMDFVRELKLNHELKG
jgi:hypothetical protein